MRVIGKQASQAQASRDLLYGMIVEQMDDVADIEEEVNDMEAGSNRIEVKMKLMDTKYRLTRQVRDLIGLGVGEAPEDTLIEDAIEVR